MSIDLDRVLKQHIRRVEAVHDYVQLHFENGGILSIFNKYSIASGTIADLGGADVRKVEIRDSHISLVLSNGVTLRVGLSDSDFRGPEALLYAAPNGDRVVVP